MFIIQLCDNSPKICHPAQAGLVSTLHHYQMVHTSALDSPTKELYRTKNKMHTDILYNFSINFLQGNRIKDINDFVFCPSPDFSSIWPFNLGDKYLFQ